MNRINISIFKNGIVIIVALLLFFANHPVFASQLSKKKNKDWFISGRAGLAVLSREFSNELVLLDKEFQHQPGWAFDVNLGRTFGEHWEPMLRGGMFYLHGKSETPDFSALGNHHSLSGFLYNIPVQYITLGGSVSGVIRYYFKKFSDQQGKFIRLDPFVEAGAGANFFSTELSYQNQPPGSNSTVIFQKGVENNQTIANITQVIFGFGTKIGNPKKWHLIISYNSDIVNYACLDAVHNYTENERNHAKGIISKLTAGVVIPLGSASGGNGGSGNNYYPWSP